MLTAKVVEPKTSEAFRIQQISYIKAAAPDPNKAASAIAACQRRPAASAARPVLLLSALGTAWSIAV
ncbi:MAG: hypothetical protein EA425_06245 [Puniceicoccaceae bacterium]|nr:MAG: hypothetical protein EA425_06245 [Puniceicoccaceae bacterium]